jgi:hypothetical protein
MHPHRTQASLATVTATPAPPSLPNLAPAASAGVADALQQALAADVRTLQGLQALYFPAGGCAGGGGGGGGGSPHPARTALRHIARAIGRDFPRAPDPCGTRACVRRVCDFHVGARTQHHRRCDGWRSTCVPLRIGRTIVHLCQTAAFLLCPPSPPSVPAWQALMPATKRKRLMPAPWRPRRTSATSAPRLPSTPPRTLRPAPCSPQVHTPPSPPAPPPPCCIASAPRRSAQCVNCVVCEMVKKLRYLTHHAPPQVHAPPSTTHAHKHTTTTTTTTTTPPPQPVPCLCAFGVCLPVPCLCAFGACVPVPCLCVRPWQVRRGGVPPVYFFAVHWGPVVLCARRRVGSRGPGRGGPG